MKLRMHGGVPPRHTRGSILPVSLSLAVCYDHLTTADVVAVQALSQTVTFLTKAGRFRQAADREKEIGQIYLQELNDLRKACESFERAAEWYSQEDATACVQHRSRLYYH